MIFSLPRFYPIIDAGFLARQSVSLVGFAGELYDAGIRFVQYRDKDSSDEQVLERMALLRRIFTPGESTLILNDRAWLAVAAGADGVHLGRGDMDVREARRLLGTERLIGLSAHDASQLADAAGEPADYLAIGPVFLTATKQNPDPVMGVEGVVDAVQELRQRSPKPLVAIGGINRENCAAVLAAGADSISVISDLLPHPGSQLRVVVGQFRVQTGCLDNC